MILALPHLQEINGFRFQLDRNFPINTGYSKENNYYLFSFALNAHKMWYLKPADSLPLIINIILL